MREFIDSREAFVGDWAEFELWLDGDLDLDEGNRELLELDALPCLEG